VVRVAARLKQKSVDALSLVPGREVYAVIKAVSNAAAFCHYALQLALPTEETRDPGRSRDLLLLQSGHSFKSSEHEPGTRPLTTG